MSIRLYSDATRCAIYEEASGGGDPLDPNSQMNRPVINPTAWLPNVYFHSDLDYYGIAAQATVSISHASIAGQTNPTEGAVQFLGQAVSTNHLLVTHGLGYVPRFFCIYNGRLIPHGTPVQDAGSGKKRYVTAYATTTQIRLFEVGYSDNTSLPAVSRNYQIIAFRDPTVNPTNTALNIEPGQADFGFGHFRGSEPHLRADGAGDVQWPIATRRTAAIRNGGLRVYQPNGTFVDLMDFTGSLAAPTYITTSAGV